MASTDPAKRIPKTLGTDAKIVGSYTLTDVAVALGPGVLIVLTLQLFLPPSLTVRGIAVQSFTLPLAVVGVLLGGLFVYLTPAYTSSLNWLGLLLRFHRSDRAFSHEAAKPHTRVQRVHPVGGAVERTDGTMLGMVHVDPPSLALATDAEWRTIAGSFADFCNTVVEFPVQFYSTTRAFPVDAYLDRYVERLADPAVRANTRLTRLIEQYVEWYAADIAQRRMTVRDHYVVVTVSPAEVQFERESLRQQLARLPVVGRLVEARYAPRDVERRAAQFEALDERLRRIETGIRGIDGCAATRVDVETATRLIGEFWAGQSPDTDEQQPSLRTRPIIGGPR